MLSQMKQTLIMNVLTLKRKVNLKDDKKVLLKSFFVELKNSVQVTVCWGQAS